MFKFLQRFVLVVIGLLLGTTFGAYPIEKSFAKDSGIVSVKYNKIKMLVLDAGKEDCPQAELVNYLNPVFESYVIRNIDGRGPPVTVSQLSLSKGISTNLNYCFDRNARLEMITKYIR